MHLSRHSRRKKGHTWMILSPFQNVATGIATLGPSWALAPLCLNIRLLKVCMALHACWNPLLAVPYSLWTLYGSLCSNKYYTHTCHASSHWSCLLVSLTDKATRHTIIIASSSSRSCNLVILHLLAAAHAEWIATHKYTNLPPAIDLPSLLWCAYCFLR